MRKSITAGIILLSILFLPFASITGFAKVKRTSTVTPAATKIKPTTSSLKVKPTQKHLMNNPDLSIENMKWSFPLKQGNIVGKNSILNFTLKNKGKAPSGNFTITFNCPKCPPSMTGTRKIPSMAPGATMGHNWPSVPGVPEKWSAGAYGIEAIVDPSRVIKDSNRANNRKILKFIVQPSPISKQKFKISNKKLSTPNLSKITVGKRTTSGFDFTTIPEPGTIGKRIVSGFDFSTQPIPGTTGTRIVKGFDFSTQPAPGTTGKRVVQGFDFIKQ